MTHAEQTADGLATWIERRTHTPAELRQILRLALQDAEKRGAQLASLETPPDPPAEPARPLNAHVGRRMPVARTSWIEDTNAAIEAAREGLARLGPAFREAA